ncbi:HipA family kinase [Neobacillus drentensis]|uniref:HipA family kinase n=1 Tax=Neobacillus drentensis TaxID=220684 RepID=UPI002FFFBF51
MITPVNYVKKLDGKSNAHLIAFNDGKEYVVKFFQPGMEKTLPNEWIGYCLARYLGLPIPFARIVDIPPEFLANEPQLADELFSTQYQFASLYIKDCKNGHQVEDDFRIKNHQPLAGIILLDYWLYNQDRTRKNILLNEAGKDTFQLWIIDHAEIFGSNSWLHTDLEVLPEEVLKSATHWILAKNIKDEECFREYFDLIETMPIYLIEEIVSVIPDEWMVSAAEKKAIVTTLVTRRRKILPQLMEKFKKKVFRPKNIK